MHDVGLEKSADREDRASNGVSVVPLEPTRILKDQVYQALREAISTMDIYSTPEPPRLDERKLAEDLGVSRTPVREALSLPEHEGFVKNIPRRGTLSRID